MGNYVQNLFEAKKLLNKSVFNKLIKGYKKIKNFKIDIFYNQKS